MNVKEYITFLGTAGNLNCKKSGTKLPHGTYKNSSVKLLWIWSVKDKHFALKNTNLQNKDYQVTITLSYEKLMPLIKKLISMPTLYI